VYYYAAVATGPGGSSAPSLQDSGFATTGASLAGVGTSSFAPINLTANGTSDWAKWPNYNHKATGGAQISDYTKVGSASVLTYGDDQRPISWSDGTPLTAATNDSSGIYIAGVDMGFQISAPADTATRTLYVYVGGWKSSGRLVAHLSDSSVPDYVDVSFSSGVGQFKAVYTLTYRAATAGQRLVVTWTQASAGGNVTLQAAALAGGGASLGSLSGVSAPGSGPVNLTTTGTGDWAKWPNYIQKSSGGDQISDYTRIGSGSVATYNNDLRPLSWSDGTPTVSATADRSGLYMSGIDNGFQISAPADTTARTLYVYVGGWKSQGKLTAHLSDNSSADYVDTSLSSSVSQYNGVYTLTYRAASSGQRLIVSWTQAGTGGNVTLQAAALTRVTATTSGSLAASGAAGFTSVDLTATGTSDWAKWPNYIHKAGGGAQIPDSIKIGAGTVRTYDNDQRPLTWSDGTPTPTGTSDTSGLYVAGIGNGFQLSAPADTTSRTLYVYVGGWASSGTLLAHLSDNSADDFSDTTFSSAGGQYDAVYTITYRAASASQQLVVQWTQASGAGNVTLQGAALR
jgi:uncharacterized protein YndB with AHSA1/START domain